MEFDLLIIDDDDLFLFLGKREVIKNNIHNAPLLFPTAQKALNWLDEHSVSNKDEVIFLDINMPDMDGWGFLDAMIAKNYAFVIKVIIVSSSIDPKDHVKANGYNQVIDYIEKPITQKSLERVKELEGLSAYFA